MKALALAAVLLATTAAFAVDENVVKTEKTESKQVTSGDKTTTQTTTTSFEARLRSAYQHAGVDPQKLDRLIVLDNRIREARKANDTVKMNEYVKEQTTFITPEQIEKLRIYLREHPAAVPAEEVTVWEQPGAGIQLNTPLGSVGVGTPGKVIEERRPAPLPVVPPPAVPVVPPPPAAP